MKTAAFKKFIPIIMVFIFVNAILLILRQAYPSLGAEVPFLAISNAILFGISLLAFFLNSRGAVSPNAHAFVRGLYGSFLLKLVVIAGCVFFYIFGMKGELHYASLLGTMFIYILYTAVEVRQLMKIARK